MQLRSLELIQKLSTARICAQDELMASQAAFPSRETHRIASLASNRLVVSSDGRGWRHVYASLATEQSWSATVPAVDHLCLAYCVSGSAQVRRRVPGVAQAHSAELRPRSFGTIPAQVESHWQVTGAPQVMLLYLRRTLVEQVVAEVYEGDTRRAEIRPILGESEPLLEQLALAVLSELRVPSGVGGRLYTDALAHTLAVQTLYALGNGVSRQRALAAQTASMSRHGVQRVLDYIDTALDQDLSLATLAGVADYSPHFFARAFKKQVGQSLHQYVVQRRIERARQLLLRSDQPISQIALLTGFSGQSHFTSVFRRLTGITPAEYRTTGAGVI